MSEAIDDLRILAKQVRNASSQGENTAERVGHVMEGTLDLIEGASPDLSKYYTKQESDTLLLSKWTYDAARAASWDEASKDRHTHTNKPALDLIVYDPVKNVWKFTGNAAFSGDVISYANLGDVDVPTIYEGLPIDNKTIKRDINGVLFAESTTGSSFNESSMWEALGTSISSKLIAQRYLNLSGYATEAYVTEKIQGLGAVFNLKGAKATPSDLPTTGNKVGDVWYVASESVGYIWIADEKGVLRWEKFGEPVDLSAYYTKTETNSLLANKWTTDTVLISQWNDAYTLRHSHSNKAILDGITNALINNWNSSAADAHKHANKSALDMIVYDSAKNVWKFTGNAAFSGDVISYANLGDLNIPSIYEGLPIDNVTIKRNSAGALYSLSGSGGDFDKAAMWAALALSTTEQINKSHLTDALSTYVLTTDSRLSDSRNAKDVYAWAKQPNPPDVDLSGYLKKNPIGITSSSDLNNISGVIISSGYSVLNSPISGDVGVLTIPTWIDGGKYSAQFVFNLGKNDIRYRSTDSSGSGFWEKIAFESVTDARYLPLAGGVIKGPLTVDNIVEVRELDAIGGRGLVMYSGSNTSLGMAEGTTSIRSGRTDLYHFIGDSNYKIWDEFNDGVGSGLDADLWKGLQPNQTNVLSATKLQTPRLIFGQSFDGTGNVDGNLTTSGKIASADASFDSFRTKGGIVAEGNTLQLGNIRLIVNPSAKTIRFEMLDGTPCNIVSTGDMIIYN